MEKYFIFFGALLVAVPLGTALAAYSRRIREWVFGLLVFSTAFTDWYDINFVERWWYAGSTRGIEVSVVDLLTLVLLFSTLVTMRREGWRAYWPASLALMLLFLAYSGLSVLTADPKIFGLFELTKLVRGLVVFIAVAWYVRTPRHAHIMIFALSAALVYNGGFAVVQRYLWHDYRVHGTFAHSNVLGDYCILVGPIVLAATLSRIPLPAKVFCGVAWLAAAVATILTIARMPSAMFLAGSAGVFLTAHSFRFSLKNVALTLLLSGAVVVVFYRGFDALEERQLAQSADHDTVEGGRSGHYLMGMKMAEDHPFGVGLNNWGWFFHEYAHWAGREDVLAYASTNDQGEGKATQGHTLYGLTLGELGWPGLAIFLVLVGRWLFLSGSLLFARRPDLWSRMGVGCFFGFLAEFIGNATEITFRNQQIFIIFNLLLGFVVAARYARVQEMKTNR